MAIVQISQIKHRHGLQEDLPQLATAELGWSVDTRKLYVGNGTLAEGAPEVGNTEILTEHSNLPNYTTYTVGVSPGQTANLTAAITTTSRPALYIQYAVTRFDNSRVGWVKFASNLSNVADFSIDEEFTQTSNIGVVFGATTVGTTGPGAYAQVNVTLSTDGVFGPYSANVQYTVSTLAF